MGAIQDVAERKKLQDLLEKANTLSRIGSFELDLTNGGLYWSPMTRKIHEVEEDFILEADTALCFYKKGKSRNRIKSLMRREIEENEPFDEELEIVTKRAQDIWVRVMAQPELENGKCIRIEGSFLDIDKI